MVEPKYLKFFEASDADVFLDEDGRTANLHFLGQDGTPIVVTVHRRSLEMLRNRIENMLAEAPNPFGPVSKS